jgi:hypothetical protein
MHRFFTKQASAQGDIITVRVKKWAHMGENTPLKQGITAWYKYAPAIGPQYLLY